MKYVTVGDPITRVLPQSLVLETAEIVDRHGFSTTTPNIFMRHEEEGVLWLRGFHMPDTELVQAARAAQAMAETNEQALPPGVPWPAGFPALPASPPPVPLPPSVAPNPTYNAVVPPWQR